MTDIVKEEIVTKDGARIRVREYSDGSREQTLVDVSPEVEQMHAETREWLASKKEGEPSPAHATEEWRAKTAAPIGLRDDGAPFTDEEGEALRKLLRPAPGPSQ